jgi:hypothetical protein
MEGKELSSAPAFPSDAPPPPPPPPEPGTFPIAVVDDARGVFNLPWNLHPFTLDLRPLSAADGHSFAAAFPLPFLQGHAEAPSSARARVLAAVQDAGRRAREGWLPTDNFAGAVLATPLDGPQASALARWLSGELQRRRRRREDEDRRSAAADADAASTAPASALPSGSSGTVGPPPPAALPSPPLLAPSPLSAAADHVTRVTELLASGEGIPGKCVVSFTFLTQAASSSFLARYPFMRAGRTVQSAGTGAFGLGGIAPFAIARAIPPLPFCVDDGVFLGAYEHATSGNVFARLRLGAVVNVTLARECPNAFEDPRNRSVDVKADVRYLRLAVADTTREDIKAPARSAAAFIVRARSEGRSVLVHCHAGLSRSVTVVLAYLLLAKGLGLEQAWARLDGYLQHGARPRPNMGFWRQLLELEDEERRRRGTGGGGGAEGGGGDVGGVAAAATGRMSEWSWRTSEATPKGADSSDKTVAGTEG